MNSNKSQEINPGTIMAAIAHYAVPGGIGWMGLLGLVHVTENKIPWTRDVISFLWYPAMSIFLIGGIFGLVWLFAFHMEKARPWFYKTQKSSDRKAKLLDHAKYFSFVGTSGVLGLFALVSFFAKVSGLYQFG